MSDPCTINYTYGCPCFRSPQFISLAEEIGDIEASNQLNCPLNENSSQGNYIPYGGKASEFGGNLDTIISDFSVEASIIFTSLILGLVLKRIL